MILTFKRWTRWPHSSRLKRRVLSGSPKFDVTQNELVARLLELGSTHVVVGLGFDESEMRDDGWPRANALPRSAGVLLMIECRLGTLFLACDTYVHWLQNLHALVSVLDSVRKAAIHEVVPASQLYAPFRWDGLAEWLADSPFSQDLSEMHISATGKGKWTSAKGRAEAWSSSRPTEPPPPRSKASPKDATPPKPPTAKAPPSETFSTRTKAATWLAERTGALASALLVDERAFVEAYRLAARALHPDVGGEAAQFRRLQNAKAVIERGAPWTR